MFKIGEFARFSRVSIKMLRHYDRIGLFEPAHIDPHTGYRYYTADQLPRLNRIIALKDLGFGLADIGDMLAMPVEEMRLMLETRRAALEQHISEEQARLTRVEARLTEIEGGTHPYDVVVRRVDAQLIASVRASVFGYEIADLFEEVEYAARDHRAARSALTIMHGMTADGFDIEVAVPLDSRIPETERVQVRTLPGHNRMACVIHAGRYTGMGDAARYLLRWLDASGQRMAGPMREVYLRYNPGDWGERMPASYLTEDSRRYVTELQVPVEAGG